MSQLRQSPPKVEVIRGINGGCMNFNGFINFSSGYLKDIYKIIGFKIWTNFGHWNIWWILVYVFGGDWTLSLSGEINI